MYPTASVSVNPYGVPPGPAGVAPQYGGSPFAPLSTHQIHTGSTKYIGTPTRPTPTRKPRKLKSNRSSAPSHRKRQSHFLCLDCDFIAEPVKEYCCKPQVKPRGAKRDAWEAISIDSMSDLDVTSRSMYGGHRAGPKVGDADDIHVTFRDLFPFCYGLFDRCGCCGTVQVKKRGHETPKKIAHKPGPQLETVCLECGGVLEHHELPALLKQDVYDRNQIIAAPKIEYDYAGERISDKHTTYSGYKDWTIEDDAARERRRMQAIPLPNFPDEPSRTLRNRPGTVDPSRQHWAESDMFDIEAQSGRVALPRFVETKDGKLPNLPGRR